MLNTAETFLVDFHRRFPGCTSRAFGGTSSYEHLVRAAEGATSLLDLGCGDGHLLERIAFQHPQVALAGVDISPDELAIARGRLPQADLRQERAQTLSFPSGTFDAIVCHMVLMLLTPLDGAVSEMRRVLKAGGVLAAVLPGEPAHEGGYGVFLDLLRALPHWGGAGPHPGRPPRALPRIVPRAVARSRLRRGEKRRFHPLF